MRRWTADGRVTASVCCCVLGLLIPATGRGDEPEALGLKAYLRTDAAAAGGSSSSSVERLPEVDKSVRRRVDDIVQAVDAAEPSSPKRTLRLFGVLGVRPPARPIDATRAIERGTIPVAASVTDASQGVATANSAASEADTGFGGSFILTRVPPAPIEPTKDPWKATGVETNLARLPETEALPLAVVAPASDRSDSEPDSDLRAHDEAGGAESEPFTVPPPTPVAPRPAAWLAERSMTDEPVAQRTDVPDPASVDVVLSPSILPERENQLAGTARLDEPAVRGDGVMLDRTPSEATWWLGPPSVAAEQLSALPPSAISASVRLAGMVEPVAEGQARVRDREFTEPGMRLARHQDQAVDGPFEVIDESGELTVQVRRSKLLRTQMNIFRTAVVDPQICDVIQFTPREVSVIGKGQGATHVTFWFEGEQRPVTYLVKVTPDKEETRRREMEYRLLEEVLAELFPDSKVELIAVADKLIVRGEAKDSEEASQIMAIVRNQAGATVLRQGGPISLADGTAAQVLSDEATGRRDSRQIQVINMLRVPGIQQVALRVKIAELNRSAARGFGVDLDARINLSAGSSALFLQSLLNASAGNAPALLTQFDGDDIKLGIRYLQQRGVLRLLSEPTLVTLSGRPATFVAGGEFAVPTIVGNVGLSAVTTDFRAFGVIISFVPTVIDKDRVRLEVAPEFSQINQELSVNDTPGLNVRAVTTTVEMREGQTLAIAGLLEDTMTGNTTGDLPLVSRWLGRRDATRNETELIILVTPELVHPMEPEEVPPLPGFDVTEPTSAEFFLHGQLEGDPTQDHRSTVWPRLRRRYGAGGPAMISGPFGHGQ